MLLLWKSLQVHLVWTVFKSLLFEPFLSPLCLNHFQVTLVWIIFKSLLFELFHYYGFSAQAHQDQGRSYKEVCAPVVERCLFLYNELRPATGDEINTFIRSKLLRSNPRWKEIIGRIVEDKKKSKSKIYLNIILYL